MRIGDTRTVSTPSRQRADLRFELYYFGKNRPCLIEIAPVAKRPREVQMDKVALRIYRARLPEEIYCLIHMAEKKVASTQCPVTAGDPRLARIQPNGSLDLGNGRFRLAEEHERDAEMSNRVGVTAVELYSGFEFELCFDQAVLDFAKVAHRGARRRTVCIVVDSFEEQLFGACLILLKRAAPSVDHIANQDSCDADPRIDRPGVHLQGLF